MGMMSMTLLLQCLDLFISKSILSGIKLCLEPRGGKTDSFMIALIADEDITSVLESMIKNQKPDGVRREVNDKIEIMEISNLSWEQIGSSRLLLHSRNGVLFLWRKLSHKGSVVRK